MKKVFNFGKIDYEGTGIACNSVIVEVEYKDEDEKRFSVCANVWNARHSDIITGGQCLDDITPYIKSPVYSEILRLWKLYHLNDMHPECEHQAALGWREKAAKKVTLYKYTMTIEAIRQQNEIKRKVLEAAKNGESWEITEVEKIVLGLDYSITSHLDTLPEYIASYYKLEKTETKALGWLRENEHPEGILSKSCPVCGYKYGNAWNYFPIPEDDEAIILKLLKEGSL